MENQMKVSSIAGLLVLATLVLSACGNSSTTASHADAASTGQDAAGQDATTGGPDTGGQDATTGDPDTATGGTDATDPGVKCGLTLSDPNVRGCEILLSEGTAKIDSVTFDGTVVGTFIREAPKVAISFVAAKDAPMANGAIQVKINGDAKQVTVKKVSCVDVKAAAMAGVAATLN